MDSFDVNKLFSDFLYWLAESMVSQKVLITAILIIIVFLIQKVLVSYVESMKGSNPEIKRKWSVKIKNFSYLLMTIISVVIWLGELKALSISILAVAVAFVIATKELILCFLGGVLRISNDTFSLGDRIEIKSKRGKVIDVNLFNTRLLELDSNELHYTGNIISLPNSYFLDTPLVNETPMSGFSFCNLDLEIPKEMDVYLLKNLIEDQCELMCSSYIENFKIELKKTKEYFGLNELIKFYSVTVCCSAKNGTKLMVRLPLPQGDESEYIKKIRISFKDIIQHEKDKTQSEKDKVVE